MRNFFIIICIFFLTSCSQNKSVVIEVPLEEYKNSLDLSIEQGFQEMKITDEKSNNFEVKHIVTEVLQNEIEPKNQIQKNQKINTEQDIELKKQFQQKENKTIKIQIPASLNNNADFVSQAPNANWDEPYKEACEEASLIMAKYAILKQELTKEKMDSEILNLVKWQNERFGFYEDTNAEQTLIIAKEYFGLNGRIIKNPSIDIIKNELAQNHFIVALVAGQKLGNIYYRQPGPLYHALLITGYNQSEFITNDPGTKRGEGYKYKYTVLINALHDFNNGDVENGEPVILVLW